MPTFNQQFRNIKIKKFRKKSRAKLLSRLKAPMKRGVVRKIRIMKPKKPNSAQRKTAKVKLKSGKFVNCYIPGLGHNLRDFSAVFFRGNGPKDLNGIQY